MLRCIENNESGSPRRFSIWGNFDLPEHRSRSDRSPAQIFVSWDRLGLRSVLLPLSKLQHSLTRSPIFFFIFLLEDAWTVAIIQQRMTKCLLPTHPIILFLPEASPYEVFGSLWNTRVEDNGFVVDGTKELHFAAGRPRRVPMKHFVVDKPNRPEIRFRSIDLVAQNLRAHIQRCPYNRLQDSVVSVV